MADAGEACDGAGFEHDGDGKALSCHIRDLSKCDLLYDQQLPIRTCAIGNDRVRSFGDNVPFSRRFTVATRQESTLPAAVRCGGKASSASVMHVNRCINLVRSDEPKLL
ncbi:hypothetical protein B0G71_8063 [Paraburkholderia sp. BL27I4N3]|nr:hypothetical protein B0G71_8063 [Paraburkholderia sp. BL27I4N3]